MPGDHGKTPGSAGISSEPVDVAAVFARLQEEVRRGRSPVAAAPVSGPHAARVDAERLWSVAVDVPIERRPGPRGRFVYAVKRGLRKLMSWYVGPFATDQRNFNHTLLRLVDDLERRLEEARRTHDVGREELRQRDRRIAELEDRVLRLERAWGSPRAAEREPGPGGLRPG